MTDPKLIGASDEQFQQMLMDSADTDGPSEAQQQELLGRLLDATESVHEPGSVVARLAPEDRVDRWAVRRPLLAIAAAAVLVAAAGALLIRAGNAERGPTAMEPPRELRGRAVSSARAVQSAVPAQSASAAPEARDPTMVSIPGGTYRLGCPKRGDYWCDAAPERPVAIEAFAIDRTEVTVADYRRCVEADACSVEGIAGKQASAKCNWKQADRDRHPINCVNYAQAAAYCEWAGKRLPTGDEWEVAARGDGGPLYPGGDGADSVTLRRDACTDRLVTCEVGTHPPEGPFELRDMAGNVAEWTSTGYKNGRGLAGGRFTSGKPMEASYARRKSEKASLTGRASIGFRCAR